MVSRGIAQEVRVKLGLQHAYLRLIELTLVLNELLLVALERDEHSVEALGQSAQLVVVLGLDIDVEVVAA